MIIISCNESQCDITSLSPSHDLKMVTVTTCSHCKEAKKILSNQINNGRIQVIDENHANFMNLMKKFDLEGVPTIIVDNEATCDILGNSKNPKLECSNGLEIDLNG